MAPGADVVGYVREVLARHVGRRQRGVEGHVVGSVQPPLHPGLEVRTQCPAERVLMRLAPLDPDAALERIS